MAGSPPSLVVNLFNSPPSHTTTSSRLSRFQTLIASPQTPLQPPQDAAPPAFFAAATTSTSTGKGVLIGLLSAFGTAGLVGLVLLIIYFFNFTQRGRIMLDRLGRPGEYDDEQQFAKDEAEALEDMDDMQRMEYLRAKAFVQANPPESAHTDISLSQFLAIQEKGVSAWEFEPELEIANCFVEGRTQIEFFDSECSVQSNLPVPKQNEVYYWEAKIYEKPENTLISIGMTTKPYPLFRLPGLHRTSIAYLSPGCKRASNPFTPHSYGPPGGYVQGDVVGVGYRPRTGSIFFTRNGKKLDDVVHGLKSPNFFPTVGARGAATVHVNFGQAGFVFIEANVKKWGLAPMTGSLAPPPPYGSEQGSILLEGGREGVREGMGSGGYAAAVAAAVSVGFGHARSGSAQLRLSRQNPMSPGPQRSPTDISLAQLSLVDSSEGWRGDDAGEGTSGSAGAHRGSPGQRWMQHQHGFHLQPQYQQQPHSRFPPLALGVDAHAHVSGFHADVAPPEYESPEASPDQERARESVSGDLHGGAGERTSLLDGRRVRREGSGSGSGSRSPPIPSYEVALAESARVGSTRGGRGRGRGRGRRETR